MKRNIGNSKTPVQEYMRSIRQQLQLVFKIESVQLFRFIVAISEYTLTTGSVIRCIILLYSGYHYALIMEKYQGLAILCMHELLSKLFKLNQASPDTCAQEYVHVYEANRQRLEIILQVSLRIAKHRCCLLVLFYKR